MIFQTCAGAKGFRKWFVTMAGAICPRGVVDEKWTELFFGDGGSSKYLVDAVLA